MNQDSAAALLMSRLMCFQTHILLKCLGNRKFINGPLYCYVETSSERNWGSASSLSMVGKIP